jgi:integrase/recombinase XerD
MGLAKQAKTLSDTQQKSILAFLGGRTSSKRDTVMFLLSVDAGLRAKEIASLEWKMLTDAEGKLTDTIRLPNKASKGKSGGVLYMSSRLRFALNSLAEAEETTGPVIKSRSGIGMNTQVVVNWFFNLYREMGFDGCSSHSGRRTAITRWARKISSVGGSMRDVQVLARHSSLTITQRYVEISEDAMRRVVG